MCQVVQTTEDALASRLLHATIQALELYSVYLGKELVDMSEPAVPTRA